MTCLKKKMNCNDFNQIGNDILLLTCLFKMKDKQSVNMKEFTYKQP